MRCAVALGAVALAAGLSVPASAQEQAEDEADALSSSFTLAAPAALERTKRRAARETGSWVGTLLGRFASGYDSNIHKSPSSPVDSAFFRVDAGGELLRYFGERHRLKMAAEVTNVPHIKSSNVDRYEQELRASYSFRFDESNRFFLSGYARHANNSETRIDGSEFTRDFEHFAYRVRPTLRHELTDRQTLRIGYYAKRKDYLETPGLESLDWWSHGPGIDYEIELGDDVEVSTYYDFRVQRYDAEPASLRDGDEIATNPSEEHFHHVVGIDIEWQPVDWLNAGVSYRFKRKDDRFKNFESYDSQDATIRVALLPVENVTLQAYVAFRHRQYDNRPADPVAREGKLEYDRLSVGATFTIALSPNILLFAQYGLTDRDSNRNIGSSYRSYEIHQTALGMSFAY